MYQFSQSDRSEFRLNGSRPTNSSSRELARNPPRKGSIFRAARLHVSKFHSLNFACVTDTLNLLYRVNGLDEYVGQLQRRLNQLHYTFSPVLDVQRREGPELDYTIRKKQEGLYYF